MLHIRRNASPCQLWGMRRRRCSSSANTKAVGLCHAAVERADLLETPGTQLVLAVAEFGCRVFEHLLRKIIALLLRFRLLFETGETSTTHHTTIPDNPQTKTVDIAIGS
jgi:hypothetical protein